jgi:protein ImuA
MGTYREHIPMPVPNPALLHSLRAQLHALAPRARYGVLPFGDARIDGCFPEGGLALGALHEIAANGIEAETGAVAAGFITCLLARLKGTLVWIAPQADLYAPGLLAYGLDPGRLVLVQTGGDDETLAAMEAVLREGAAAAVVAEAGRLGRIPSRRLQLACLKRGSTGFVLRRWPHGRKAVVAEETASVTRWRLAPAPSAAAHREPGRPRWRVELEHARGGIEGAWIMEVEKTDATHPLRVVAELADAAVAPPRQRSASGQRESPRRRSAG